MIRKFQVGKYYRYHGEAHPLLVGLLLYVDAVDGRYDKHASFRVGSPTGREIAMACYCDHVAAFDLAGWCQEPLVTETTHAPSGA